MIRDLSVRELSKGLADNTFSSVEITQEFLTAAQADTNNAFLSFNEHALDHAREADAKIASKNAHDLTGIPLAIKDVLATHGHVTTAASKMLESYVPPYSATVVERLTDAGMVVLGKTNCDEFAMGGSNEFSAFGPVKNPYDAERVSGGSSGGSAVAVAAKLAPIALGTDTGGSVRLPAAFCGVVGFKPTYGRISRYGLFAMASSLDQVGIFSHTAEDAAMILEIAAGVDPKDATSSGTPVEDYASNCVDRSKSMTIGVPKEYFSEHVDPAMEELVSKTIESYKSVPGLIFREVSLPHTSHALSVYYIIMSGEVSSNMARYDGIRYGTTHSVEGALGELYAVNRGESLGVEVKRRIMLGTFALSTGYYDKYYAKASKVRRLIADDFTNVFETVDAVIAPVSPTPAFRIGEKIKDPLQMYLSDILTVSANLAGIPAITYPIGDVGGLPVGLQLMGPQWSESLLLQLTARLHSQV